MRKILLPFALLFSAVLFAQEADHVPLLEHFTNSRCPICASRNPGFHDLRDNYEGQVNHVSFHPRFPYSNCVFYQANTDGNMVRTNFHNISGTPSVYVDGERGSGSTLVSEGQMDQALMQKSYFELQLQEELDGNNLNGSIVIRTRGNIPAGKTYRIYIMGVEELVQYNAPNGEQMHYNVFRRFENGGQGVPFTPASNGEETTISFSIDVSNADDVNQMYTLAFIQDNDDVIETSVSKFTQSTVSSDQTAVEELVVYPNPVQNELNIKGAKGDWQLLNLMGMPVMRGPSPSRVTVSHLPKGVYFLRTEDAQGSKVVRKVIKE